MPNTLRVKRGLAASLPNGASGEPLFTTDTYELYIGKGDGTNQRYQKYIASGTTSQYLRGDGSLETHNLDSLTDVVVSSPSNGQFLKYNGTNWVNSAGGFLTGGATAAGQVGVFDSTTNIVGYTTFTYDTVTDKLSMTNGYVNNNLTVDGQLVIKSESGASAYTRGLKFPDNSYGGTGDIAGLRLYNAGGENIILELYAGNDSLDTINFAVAAGGSTYNDNVTINGNKIWNAGNLPSPLSSTGTINSGEIPIFSNSTTVYSDTALFWDNSLNRLGVGGTSPNAQVGVSTSSGVNAFGYRTSGASYYELVLAYDNTTYGHTFQANRGASTSARNITFLNGSNTISIDESGNMGIGLVTPNAGTSGPGGLGLDIYASTTAALALHNSTSGTGISAGGRIYYNSTNMTIRNLSTGNLTMTADSGNFVVITNGAENVKVEGSTGKLGIGNPASIAEMLTVNGSIQQSAVTSAITKTDANGKIVAAVAGTDYVAPSALSGYVPTSRTLTINGTTYDLSANRSWTVGIIDGGGSAGRVTYWSDADTVTSDGGFIYDSSTKRLGVNTTVPNATIGATAASGYGLLIKNADSNYGGIGMGVDATYGNLINTEKLGTAPARNLTLLNQSGYISLDESGNMGVNILTPNASTSGPGGIGIDIYSSTTAALAFHNSTSGTGSAEGGRIYYNSTNMTIRNLETGNISITADNGNFQVITLGAENIKVEGSTGKVGIGAPASIAEMLTVNGSIQQSAVTSSMLKANASGKIIAAVSNTDFQAPITLTTNNTSGAATFNGTTLNIPQYQAAGNYITGAGNSGYLPKYTGSYTIANSLVYDNGSRVMINTTTDNTVEMLQVNGGIRGTSLRINSNANTFTAVNILGQIYVDNRSSQGGNRIFLTPNTTSTTPYVHFYEPFTAFNTNGGISIGTSNAITTTPTDSIMHWDANNIRVGINTTAPDLSLTVNGAINMRNSTRAGAFEIDASGNLWIGTATTAGNIYLETGHSTTGLPSTGTARLTLNQSGATFSSSVTAGGATISGSSNSGSGSVFPRLQVENTLATQGDGTSTFNFADVRIASGNSAVQMFLATTYAAGTWAPAAIINVATNHDLQIKTNNTERMRITSGGDIGVNTTSGINVASGWTNLTVNGSTTGIIGVQIGGTNYGAMYGNSANNNFVLQAYGASNTANMIFLTSSTERMRITSGGYLKASDNGTYNSSTGVYHELTNTDSGNSIAICRATNSSYVGDGFMIYASRNTTNNTFYALGYYNVGASAYKFRVADSGNVTNTNNSYGTISDIKLKENIVDASPKLEDILKLKVRNFNLIGDETKQIGFIAQEFEEVFPSMIEEHRDKDPEGNDLGTTTKSIKSSVLVPMLVKAIQELKTELDILKNK